MFSDSEVVRKLSSARTKTETSILFAVRQSENRNSSSVGNKDTIGIELHREGQDTMSKHETPAEVAGALVLVEEFKKGTSVAGLCDERCQTTKFGKI